MKIAKLIILFGFTAASVSLVQAQTGAPEDSTQKKVRDSASKPFDGKNIPPKLKEIQKKPYSTKGMTSCSAIGQEIRELDVVLGPDVNKKVSKTKAKKREATARLSRRCADG